MDTALNYEQLVRAARALETGKSIDRFDHEYADADLWTTEPQKAKEGMVYAFQTLGNAAIESGNLSEKEVERIRDLIDKVQNASGMSQRADLVSEFMDSVYLNYFEVNSDSVPVFDG